MSIRIYRNNTERYETKPSASSEGFPKYYNSLYKSTGSNTFETDPERIEQVLPNQFDFEYKGITYVVNHDNMSQRALEQVKSDIRNAHSASVEKFNKQGDEPTVQIYIFNNQDDNEKYTGLIPKEGSLSTYQCNSMDAFLAFELGKFFHPSDETAIAIGQKVATINYEKYIKFEEVIEFEHEGVFYTVRNKNLSTTQEERDQVIEDVKNSHASLKLTTGVGVIIDVDNNSDFVRRVILLKGNEASGLDPSLVKLSSKPAEEAEEPQGPQPTVASFMDTDEEPKTAEQELSSKAKRSVDSEYEEFRGGLGFEYQGIQYYVTHRNNLSEEEKDTIIGDVKNSHESLVNRYAELSGKQSNDCISVIIGINSDKKIIAITSYGDNSDNIDLEPLLISGNNSETELDQNIEEKPQGKTEESANLPKVSEDLADEWFSFDYNDMRY